MLDTLLKVMPLLIASTLSPGILALTVILLAKDKDGLKQTTALLVGSLITSVIIIVVGLVLGERIQDPTDSKTIDNIVDLLLAALFLYFGIVSLLHKDNDSKTKKISKDQSKKLFLWAGIGFAISITNFDAVIFDITAAKEVGQALISQIDKIIILTIEAIFFNLPILLPLILYLLVPRLAKKILDPLNIFLVKYGRFIVAIIFLGFGVYLGYKGLQGILF